MEKIIIKYLNQTISEAELAQLKDWLKDTENQTEFKKYIQLHHNLEYTFNPSPELEAFNKVQATLQRNKKRSNYRSFYKYAAVFILLLSLSGLTFFALQNEQQATNKEQWVELKLNDGRVKYIKPNETNFINSTNSLSASDKELVYDEKLAENHKKIFYNTLSVPYGKTFSIVLSDGTRVNLNAGSSLTYPTLFSKDSIHRQVYLDGEAYFDVTPQKQQSFLVKANRMDVEVLGTEFNVSAYQDDQQSYAVLVEGKIAAQNPQSEQKVTVKPGEKVFYENAELITKQTEISKHVAWVKGELVFIKDSFKVIKNKIERKYDVVINNDYEALENLMINARFKDETIEEVMQTFQTYIDFDYKINGQTIKITAPKE